MEPDRRRAPLWTEMRWLVPALATVLFLPPVLTFFDHPIIVLGVPLLPFYVFVVWAVLIGLCAAMSRRAMVRRPRPDEVGP